MTLTTSHAAHAPGRVRHVGSEQATDLAARIISEAAHDLRSPITTIRESIRLIHDGQLGEINDDQQSLLTDAMNQCDCVDQMVGEMVQLDRLRTGLPRVHRQWMAVSEIRQSIDETLRPWALPRQISVVWDGADDPNQMVFCDLESLRRLIVNLVVNAVRATTDGGSVLLKLEPLRGGEAIQWQVIDRGAGISQSDLRQIAKHQVSASGGEGLGLMICRQLAAFHFSHLKIRSRLGMGTTVSFETAAGGPAAVAACWSRWRSRAGDTPAPPSNATTRIQPGSSAVRPPRSQADTRHETTYADRATVEITCDGQTPRCEHQFAIGTVTLGAAMSREAADQFDLLLQHQLRMFELAYRVDARRWVWVLDANDESKSERIDTITENLAGKIPNIRATWSDGQVLAVGHRRTVAMLTDLLVRESLTASATTRVADANQVRLGTAPIERSEVATMRLAEEASRLSRQLKGRNATLRGQSRKLRM